METANEAAPVSKTRLWAGRIISAIPVLMLLISAGAKFVKPVGFAEGTQMLGWPEDLANTLGIIEMACAILYAIPQTAVLGAILSTAYLGGATAAHIRIGDHFFVPVILGTLVWFGLYLRDIRLRDLVPIRK